MLDVAVVVSIEQLLCMMEIIKFIIKISFFFKDTH